MVGFAVTYDTVARDELVDTADGQVIVDLASVLDEIDDEPRNGSFLPH